MKKRILIFGATGGTGQELVAQALKTNCKVSVFVRSPEKLDISVKPTKFSRFNKSQKRL